MNARVEVLLAQAVAAYLIKGGYVRKLQAGSSLEEARTRATTRPDWGLTRPSTSPTARRRVSLVIDCAGRCTKRPRTFAGRDDTEAALRAWKAGWDPGDGYCPRCKPGPGDAGGPQVGVTLHDRESGLQYKVTRYSGKGDHPSNVGKWPEVWCLDGAGHEQVFIMWENRLPDSVRALT